MDIIGLDLHQRESQLCLCDVEDLFLQPPSPSTLGSNAVPVLLTDPNTVVSFAVSFSRHSVDLRACW